MTIRCRVVVDGRVQGVFFREAVRWRASRSAVGGWVRNTDEGAVEGVFEGEQRAVEALVAFCREGPRGARVDRIEVFDETAEGVSGFSIR